MQLAAVEEICDEVLDNLPASVTDALEDIDIMVVENEADPSLDGVRFEMGFRGLFVGVQLEDEDEEGDEGKHPSGDIYICAANVENEEDAEKVILHEIGHALGLSEAQVAALKLE